VSGNTKQVIQDTVFDNSILKAETMRNRSEAFPAELPLLKVVWKADRIQHVVFQARVLGVFYQVVRGENGNLVRGGKGIRESEMGYFLSIFSHQVVRGENGN